MTVTVLDPCVWNPLWSGRVCVGSVSLQHFSSPACLLELSDPSSATDETNEPVIIIIIIIIFNNWPNKIAEFQSHKVRDVLLKLLLFELFVFWYIWQQARSLLVFLRSSLMSVDTLFICYINCDYLIDWGWFWCGFVLGSSPCSEDYIYLLKWKL